jgi:hypothetical protein
MRCNGTLEPTPKEHVADAVPPRSFACFDEFLRCGGCGRVYWRGSHIERLSALIASLDGTRG